MTITETAIEEVTTTIQLDTAELSRIMGNAVVFASSDQARPVLCGVLLELDGDELKVVSTDAYALYTETVKVQNNSNGKLSFLLTGDSAKKLSKLGKSVNASVLTFGEKLTVEAYDNGVLIVDALDGTFPDYKHITPAAFDGEVNTIAFGSKLLAKLGKVKPVNNQTGSTGNACAFSFIDDLKPTSVRIGKDIQVLLMPVRVS